MVPPEYQIYLKTWNEKTITVYVNQSDTIADVKIKISLKIDFPYTYMHLTYGGKPSKDSETLAFYNIQRESTIFTYGF